MNETNTMLLFHSLYRIKGESIDWSFPRSLPQKKEPVPGRAIWYARQGPMRVRTGPKLTKAEKKAERKDHTRKKLNRRNRA